MFSIFVFDPNWSWRIYSSLLQPVAVFMLLWEQLRLTRCPIEAAQQKLMTGHPRRIRCRSCGYVDRSEGKCWFLQASCCIDDSWKKKFWWFKIWEKHVNSKGNSVGFLGRKNKTREHLWTRMKLHQNQKKRELEFCTSKSLLQERKLFRTGTRNDPRSCLVAEHSQQDENNSMVAFPFTSRDLFFPVISRKSSVARENLDFAWQTIALDDS